VAQAIIGLLGDGQLAQMTCLAGRTLGLTMHVYAQSFDSPAAQVADLVSIGALDDEQKLVQFAQSVSVVTYDTELLPIRAVRTVAAHTRACPSPDILYIAQNRIRERAFLQSIDMPMPRVQVVDTMQRAHEAAVLLAGPGILKTAEQGYDGKGQVRVDHPEDAVDAWKYLGEVPCVLEERVSFVSEMSVLVAGSLDGAYAVYPVIDNVHERHILHLSSSPSQLPAVAQREAQRIALAIAKALSLVGLLAVEMFYTEDGRVLVNELAPRPHNSGHHTQLSAATSQFEQLCRAISGMPLGSVVSQPAAMINLLGDLFLEDDDHKESHEPPIYQHGGFLSPEQLMTYFRTNVPEGGDLLPDLERIKVYFYGKREARPGRKLGHAIAVATSVQEARAQVQHAHSLFARIGRGREVNP